MSKKITPLTTRLLIEKGLIDADELSEAIELHRDENGKFAIESTQRFSVPVSKDKLERQPGVPCCHLISERGTFLHFEFGVNQEPLRCETLGDVYSILQMLNYSR